MTSALRPESSPWGCSPLTSAARSACSFLHPAGSGRQLFIHTSVFFRVKSIHVLPKNIGLSVCGAPTLFPAFSNTSEVLNHFIHNTTLLGRWYYPIHFTDKNNNHWGTKRSSQTSRKSRFKPGEPAPEPVHRPTTQVAPDLNREYVLNQRTVWPCWLIG